MNQDPSEMHARMRKRNRMLGISLGVFVVILTVVSVYRIQGLVP